MTITELVILDLIPPYTLESSLLAKALATFTAQRSQYSAYPVAFYKDTTSSSRFYFITGWHNAAALSLCREQILSEHRTIEDFLTVRGRVYLDMNYDTIPRIGQGILCITKHTVQADEEASEGEETISTGGQRCRVAWMGGGISREENTAFYQLILYADGSSEEAIRKRNETKSVLMMRRISIPRH